MKYPTTAINAAKN